MRRLERALEVAVSGLLAYKTPYSAEVLKEIDAILHPVEVEELPLTLWWVASQPSGKRSFEDEALALRCCRNDEKPIPLQTTIRREKKVVERSVSVEVEVQRGLMTSGTPLAMNENGEFSMRPFFHNIETYGKRGTLEFRWEE